MLAALLTLVAACGGSATATGGRASSPGTARRTRAYGQWTAGDVAVLERIATGEAGTFIDLDHLTGPQLANVARAIRATHGIAHPGARSERRALILWMMGPQVHVRICAMLDEVVPAEADRPYSLELMLALTASVIESRDPTEQWLAALRGLVTNYRASRATGAQEYALLEALAAEEAAGTLAARAAHMGSCSPTVGSVDP